MDTADRSAARSGSGTSQGIFREGERWDPRPVAARALWVGIYAGPVVLALLCSLIIAQLLPEPSGLGYLPWWLAVLAVSQAVLHSARTATRSLVHLPDLLTTSLVFPDQAPSRLTVARHCADRAVLAEEARTVAVDGLPKTLDEALSAAVAMSIALDHHDQGTRQHTARTRRFAEIIAEELKLDRISREKLRWSVLLHDIGKLTIPADVLAKTDALADHDWLLLQRHTAEGERILAPLTRWLGDAVTTAGQHHERWDGKGYPRGLGGQQITLNARILAVADAFAVMTEAEGYRPQLSLDDAITELRAHAGSQFDPTVVQALVRSPQASGRPSLATTIAARFPTVAARLADVPASRRTFAARTLTAFVTVAAVLAITGTSDAGTGTPPAAPAEQQYALVEVPENTGTMAPSAAAGASDFVMENVLVTTTVITIPVTEAPTTLPAPVTLPPGQLVPSLVVPPTTLFVPVAPPEVPLVPGKPVGPPPLPPGPSTTVAPTTIAPTTTRPTTTTTRPATTTTRPTPTTTVAPTTTPATTAPPTTPVTTVPPTAPATAPATTPATVAATTAPATAPPTSAPEAAPASGGSTGSKVDAPPA